MGRYKIGTPSARASFFGSKNWYHKNMDNNVKIVKLALDDWQKYRGLRLEALKEEPAAFLSSYEEKVKSPEENWRKKLGETDVMLFAELNGKLVGMVAAFREKDQKIRHITRITSVYVNKNYRGKGIGRLLLDKVLEEIKKNLEVKKIKIEVSESQVAAYQLYKKLGFREIGRTQKEIIVDGKYYDEILMEMLL